MLSSLFLPELVELGLTPFFRNQLIALASEHPPNTAALVAGRITCERRGEYEVATASAPIRATLSGRVAHELRDDARPAVGDWVACEPADPVGRVHHVLERQSVLRRRKVDGSSRAQVLASNVDLCCVVSALTDEDGDAHAQRRALNPRRIERYLRTARESRIEVVVVVNKADLVAVERSEELLGQLAKELPNVAIDLVSTRAEGGLEPLRRRLEPGTTAVLLGSSGVGKSSIVNALLGCDVKPVAETRQADARGRHTTTERELLRLPGGAVLIDTPGMRELALWADSETDLATSGFDDLDALAATCRFSDCTHRDEPDCAVQSAIARGVLPGERLQHARKLERELLHQRARFDARVQASHVKARKTLARAMRVHMKVKERAE